MLCLGLMSGTSMDGVDAALIETDAELDVTVIAIHSFAYPVYFQRLLKDTEKQCAKHNGDLKKLAGHFNSSDTMHAAFENDFSMPLNFNNLIRASAVYHLNACKQLISLNNIDPNKIDAVAYHGQTLFHNPSEKITVQIADAQHLADELKLTTVYDFRTEDVSLGGQGAPLVPVYHRVLARQKDLIPCAILNLGGIANITAINGDSINDICGFDIGPANTLLDRYLRQKTGGKIKMDTGGKLALAGKVVQKLLRILVNDKSIVSFQNKSAPKSLDSYDFTLSEDFFEDCYFIEDVCATLVEFTVTLIANEINRLNFKVKNLIVCGGGAYNNAMLQQLAKHVETVKTAADLNWNIDSIEAECMAYLAARRLQNRHTNYPHLTGLSHAISAGKIITA